MDSGPQSLVELGPRFRQSVSRSGSVAMATAESESSIAAGGVSSGKAREAGCANWCCTAASITPTAGCRNICTRTAPGERGMREFCGRVQSRIFQRSSASTNRCRFIPAALACWLETTSRAPPILGFRWSASACFTARDIFVSVWIATDGNRKNIWRRMSLNCRSRPRSARTAGLSRSKSPLAKVQFTPKYGEWQSGVAICSCWIPM